MAWGFTSSLTALLKHFNWHTVALLTGTSVGLVETKKYIKKQWLRADITISYEALLPSVVDYEFSLWDTKFPKMLNEIKARARSKYI